MHSPTSRPDYAPENRSPNGGKFVAIGVFALLVVGGLATLVVVLTRGSSGIVPPQQQIPSARDVVAPEVENPSAESLTPTGRDQSGAKDAAQ